MEQKHLRFVLARSADNEVGDGTFEMSCRRRRRRRRSFRRSYLGDPANL